MAETWRTEKKHGMLATDTVQDYATTLGATGTKTLTAATTNTFTYTDATATGTGQVSVRYLDAMRLTAANDATASASGTATWNDYDMLSGDLFTVADYVPTLKTVKSLYWGANEGLHKIETTIGPVRKAGVPPALEYRCLHLRNEWRCGAKQPGSISCRLWTKRCERDHSPFGTFRCRARGQHDRSPEPAGASVHRPPGWAAERTSRLRFAPVV